MHLINLIFVSMALILLFRMIKLNHRAAVAAETTAIIISTFYANMTPEAKAKADDYLKSFK